MKGSVKRIDEIIGRLRYIDKFDHDDEIILIIDDLEKVKGRIEDVRSKRKS